MRYRSSLALGACLVAGAGVPGPGRAAPVHSSAKATTAAHAIRVDGYSINVKCSGPAAGSAPTIVLLAGEPDPLTKFAYIQRKLSAANRVCSYDRLGEGKSSKPRTKQTLADSAAILHKLLAKLGVSHGVLLVGHSLGGLVAAEYASQYRTTHEVKGVVLLDATPPSIVKKIEHLIPAAAAGIAAGVRSEIIGLASGQNPERLVFSGAPIGSVGKVPLTVVQHGLPIFASVPKYGRGIQQIWSSGQRDWLRLSPRSRMVVAHKSGHYIYTDQPALTLRLIDETVAAMLR